MGCSAWRGRWTTLCDLLVGSRDRNTNVDDAIGAKLDSGKHSQDIQDARFGDKDLLSQGGLPGGQFGEIDVTLCRLDNALYVRKAQPRRQALQATRERDVLLQARRTNSVWSPHLLCAYKEASEDGMLKYALVMSYVPGGTLEDVLESCGGIAAQDVRWWFSQAVCAIGWLHEQGWAHRDVKPSNFAISSSKHLQLLDYGCASPISLSTVSPEQRVLPYDDCLVPCGTCDYLSPEVLIWHENALARARANNAVDESEEEEDTFAQDFSDVTRSRVVEQLRRSVSERDRGNEDKHEGYGPETDWWSLGAMVYELAYGVAPFFASDVPMTYRKILGHEKSLRFPSGVGSPELESILRGLLTSPEKRLGRRTVNDIKSHSYFQDTEWDKLHILPPHSALVTPQFTYAPPVLDESGDITNPNGQGGFGFSAFFQSTVDESNMGVLPDAGKDTTRRLTLRPGDTDNRKQTPPGIRDLLLDGSDEEEGESSGSFCWGPPADAFDHAEHTLEDVAEEQDVGGLMAQTPFRLKVPATPLSHRTPFRQPLFGLPSTTPLRAIATPFHRPAAPTPFRQTQMSTASGVQPRQPMATPFRSSGTAAFRQSSAAATPFRQLVSTTPWRPGNTLRNSVNGHMFKTPVRPGAMTNQIGPGTGTARRTRTVTEAEAFKQVLASARKRVYRDEEPESSREVSETSRRTAIASGRISQAELRHPSLDLTGRTPLAPLIIPTFDLSLTSSEGVPGPPSPSPSPRPGSALGRRSATPSVMMTFRAMTPSGMYSRSGSRLSVRATTPTWTNRGLSRDDSDEGEKSEMERERRERRERVDKERREKVERERLKTEQEQRDQESARLERQRAKGKAKEVDEERVEPITKPGRTNTDRQLERSTAGDQHHVQTTSKQLHRSTSVQGRRKGEKETRPLDPEVEAARNRELRLAREMARRDEAKRNAQSQSQSQVDDPDLTLRPAGDLVGRRRVKSANEAIELAIPTPEPLPSACRTQEQLNKTKPELSSRTRTRSHDDPLVSPTRDTAQLRPTARVSLDDVSVRQKRLAQDVEALETRIRDVLRALQGEEL